MGRDNKDRYGKRHREDDVYDIGESSPGTVGDSEGTFHDRASCDNRVIVDGEVQKYEEHERNRQSEGKPDIKGSSHEKAENRENQEKSKVEGGQFAELDGEVVEVDVERVSGSGNPLAHYRGIHVHVPGGEPGESCEVKLDAQSGYFVGKIRLDE